MDGAHQAANDVSVGGPRVARIHVGGAGPFGPVQDVFRGSRSFKDRKITREVVGAPLAILIFFLNEQNL